jgi:hypothetical protein
LFAFVVLLAAVVEAPAQRELREYTQVIIHEADRLQTLVDRLLAPHRRPHVVGDVNIHEVCERVRAVIAAEFPRGLTIVRDYDTSLPEFRGDREHLIQAVLNIAHSAVPGAPASEKTSRTEGARFRARARGQETWFFPVVGNNESIRPYLLESGRDALLWPVSDILSRSLACQRCGKYVAIDPIHPPAAGAHPGAWSTPEYESGGRGRQRVRARSFRRGRSCRIPDV